ncbi:hypothetical protein EOPP23_15080 [Endozoicomonas sp. OPT23]|uniref:transposase n=1 Tax=Endozoicomonas sp. OPT23 TaxID=2072845 RepID=UPI00129A3A4D|nr:transposase [Endozoicomonas sp. OPT23]MRI34312.1 hypothetical protein [Endozoicomonas sp. OPT23]
MSTYRPDKPTRRYSNEYKVSAVRMTFKPGVMIKDVAASLDIHPFMLSRWRKEYFEGSLVANELNVPEHLKQIPKQKELTDAERIKKLEAQISTLRMENDFLKKWQAYVAKPRKNGSPS